ncbi:hypothetical protein B0O99DRAFT_103977 [Bisporella sp. PMI_857]|nr:hypothetical protein B0O99DRAFT_103977 [Bisporella sp. PMI_857]
MNVSMQKSLTCVQQIIGYNFADTNILWEALQAAGSDVYLIKTRRISSDGNKKMALIGDALAKAAVLESWWRKNESRAKGQGYVDTLLSNINLQRVCEESGISRYINLNPSTQGIVPPRLKSDTIEAIFAAVAEDGAASGRPNALRTVMQNLGLLP